MAYPIGLDGRERDRNGQIRKKNGETHIGTLEKTYRVDFGVRSDMKLDTYLESHGYDSLSQALKHL